MIIYANNELWLILNCQVLSMSFSHALPALLSRFAINTADTTPPLTR